MNLAQTRCSRHGEEAEAGCAECYFVNVEEHARVTRKRQYERHLMEELLAKVDLSVFDIQPTSVLVLSSTTEIDRETAQALVQTVSQQLERARPAWKGFVLVLPPKVEMAVRTLGVLAELEDVGDQQELYSLLHKLTEDR